MLYLFLTITSFITLPFLNSPLLAVTEPQKECQSKCQQQPSISLASKVQKGNKLYLKFATLLNSIPPLGNMTYSLKDEAYFLPHAPIKHFSLSAHKEGHPQYVIKMQIDEQENTVYLEKLYALNNAQGGSKAILSVFHHLLDKAAIDSASLIVLPDTHINAPYVAKLYWEMGYEFDSQDTHTEKIFHRIMELMKKHPQCPKSAIPENALQNAQLEYLKDSTILSNKLYLELPPKKISESGPSMIRQQHAPTRSLNQIHGISRGEKACWQL
jgi:hypothetical protein